MDLKALEEAPAAADMNQAQVVTNSVDDIEWQENSQALRDELHELVQDLLRRKRDSEVPAEDGVAGESGSPWTGPWRDDMVTLFDMEVIVGKGDIRTRYALLLQALRLAKHI